MNFNFDDYTGSVYRKALIALGVFCIIAGLVLSACVSSPVKGLPETTVKPTATVKRLPETTVKPTATVKRLPETTVKPFSFRGVMSCQVADFMVLDRLGYTDFVFEMYLEVLKLLEGDTSYDPEFINFGFSYGLDIMPDLPDCMVDMHNTFMMALGYIVSYNGSGDSADLLEAAEWFEAFDAYIDDMETRIDELIAEGW